MSTKREDMARSSFSTAAFAQLVRRLRHTNARYDQIAHQFRCRMRPTYHARRRAYRAGLRIDIFKARGLPQDQIIRKGFHVIEKLREGATPSADASGSAHATSQRGTEPEGCGASQGDAYMRGLSLRGLPEVVVRKPRRRGGRKRVMLRLPAFKLSLNPDCGSEAPFQGSMPGAPRLLPRQLPEEESGVEELMLGPTSSASSFLECTDSLLAPSPLDARMATGLCITIPPRGVKRKLDDAQENENAAPPQQPKRILMPRWGELQNH